MALNLVYNPINYDPVLISPLTPSINSLGLNLSSDRQVYINTSATIQIYDGNNNLIKTVYGFDPEVSFGRLPIVVKNNQSVYSATSPWLIAITKPLQALGNWSSLTKITIYNNCLKSTAISNLQSNFSLIAAPNIPSASSIQFYSTTNIKYSIFNRIRNTAVMITCRSTLGATAQ